MLITGDIEWRGGIEGRLVLGHDRRETRSGRQFLDYVRSREPAFDATELERIGSCAYVVAVCQVRATTAGFVLAAADQIVDPATAISDEASHNAAFQSGVARARDHLCRLRGQPGGTLADAALHYLKLRCRGKAPPAAMNPR